MAIKSVRIGSMEDIHQYDDVDYDSAVETDQPIKAGSPVDSNDVLRKADVGTLAGDVVGPASATDNAIARFNGTTGKVIQSSLVYIVDSGNTGVGTETPGTVNGLDLSAQKILHVLGSGAARVSITSGGGSAANFDLVEPTAAANTKWANQVSVGGKYKLRALTDAGGVAFTLLTGDLANGRIGAGVDAPLSVLHLKAGTAAANTAPFQFSSGPVETTPRAGVAEYNGNFYLSKVANTAAVRYGVGGTLNANVTAVSTTTILGADDDLQTFSVAAYTLTSTGDRVTFRASGSIVSSTSQKRLKVKFGTATLFDTGATGFPVSAAIEWVITGEIIKDGATQQCSVAMFTNNASLASYADIINAGEDSTIANTLKLTGATSGVGAASGDVVQETFTVEHHPVHI